MDHLTSVSDIPLPGEDINSRNAISAPEFNNKPIESATYTYSTTSNIRFDDNAMIVVPQQLDAAAATASQQPVISDLKQIVDTTLINSMQEIQPTDNNSADEVNMTPDTSAENQVFQESIIEQALKPELDIKPIQEEEEPKRVQTLAEAVEDLQKFVDQTTQDAVAVPAVNNEAIESMEIVEETTDQILPDIMEDTATVVTEPCEITETAEIRTETVESASGVTVNLEEIIDVPVHDNSIEIKDEEINISFNSIVSDTTTESQNEEIQETTTEEVVEEIQNEPEILEANPGKRGGRSNSTIEAIKNEWTETDGLTIEEIKEEGTSPTKSIPIIEEPETTEQEPEVVQEITHVIEEGEGDDTITDIIVVQSVNDGIELNLDQNVTIEIIDEIKQKEPEPEPEPEPEKQKPTAELKKEVVKTTKLPPPRVIIPDKKTQSEKGKQDASGKKERTVTIPCHLLGRNVDNPTEDLISNGRAPPKPRLGVKVPYRFLTSQIVSKQDITKELLEIHAKRNPQRDPPAGGDIFFAKKLTQRLASKISQSEKAKKERSETNSSGIPTDALLTPPNSQASDTSQLQGSSKSINDNSDLLAILEGDVDVDLTKEITNSKNKPSSDSTTSLDTDNQIEKALENIAKSPAMQTPQNARKRKIMDPEMEREIALKQLESLPKEVRSSVRKYGRRGRPCKYYQPPVLMQRTLRQETTTSSPTTRKEIVKVEPTSPNKPSKPVEVKVVKAPPKTALEIAQSQERELSENVKQAAENIIEKIRKKKLKDIPAKSKHVDISDDLLDTSLTPKKVSKTYSRKDTVVNVNVPADLEQIVNDQSALESEECVQAAAAPEDEVKEEKSPEKSKEMDDKKQMKSPPPPPVAAVPQQKRPKRSIGEDINTPEVTLVSKRARVIKPKIIWDPAESEPKKVKPQTSAIVDPLKPKRGRPRKSLDVVEKTEETPKKPETEAKEDKKAETAKAEDKMETEEVEEEEEEEDDEEEELEVEKDPEYKPPNKPPQKKEDKPLVMLKKKGKMLSRAALTKVQAKKKILIKRQIRSLAGKLIRSTNGDLKSSLALSRKKKQLVQKLANEVKSSNKPKKTELDKLLMDEGAVNMLYSVRQDDKTPAGKRNVSKLIPSKDLVNRTIALRKVITQSSINEDTPTKALRKKENLALSPIKITQKERKKSRDSIRSSIQSPPPSPSYSSNRAEASRIIRRHSSSFSSDCSSPRRLSIDLQNVQENAEKQDEQTVAEEPKKEAADFSSPARSLRRKGGVPIYERKADEKTYKGKKKLLPEVEANKESDSTTTNKDNKEEKESTDRLTPTPATTDKSDKSDKTEKPDKLSAAEKRKLSNEMSKNFSKSPIPKKRTRNSKNEDDEESVKEEASTNKITKTTTTIPATTTTATTTTTTAEEVEEKPKRTRHVSLNSNYEEISLRKIDNLVQIILTPSNTKLKNSISIKMFKELNDALTNLATDDTCRVVLLTSTDSSFCHGVDFSALVQSNVEKRTSVAQEMATSLKNFLRSLAHFPKPIIAGVQGSAVGLGVTMLPLFDLVFASDKATFSTPYGRLGQVPEGIAFMTLPNLLGSTLTSELMFANRKLTASEAVHHGLVTRTIWPDKFQEDVLANAFTVSSQSGQSMQATKSLLRQSLLSKLDDALESENKLLITHWTSAECQQNFKKLLQEEEWW